MPVATSAPESRKIACPHPGGKHDLHVLKWCARREGALPPVVCVHGLTRRAEDFRRMAEAISETRDVYAFSMAGRGRSDPLPPALYTYDQYIADCRHLLDQLKLQEIDWVGTSMGGIIAMRIAGSEANPIRRLVLNDIGPFIPVEALKGLALHVTGYDGTPFKSDADARNYCAFAYGSYGIYGTPFWDELLEVTIVRDADGAIRLHYDPHIVDGLRNRAAIVAPMDLWDVYDRIRTATLVLQGEDSHLLVHETASEMTRHGPRPRIATFSGCGHAPALVFSEQIGIVAGFLAASGKY